MDAEFYAVFAALAAFWFLLYWVLGGVFFAVVAILRLGRVRKVRFSCLFSLFSIIIALGASWFGLRMSNQGISDCLATAETAPELATAIFGCGFAGVLGAFLLGAAALMIGGFILMAISKSKTKPWINLGDEGEEVACSQEGFFPRKSER